jgi:SAM-dependent methyltransferase
MDADMYFETVAQDWDAMRSRFFSTQIRDFAIGVAGVQQGYRAADIGAGTGFMTEGLVSAGAQVIAVDPSGKMLAELQRKFGDSSTFVSRFLEGQRLPIEDRSLDGVFANMVLHHTQGPYPCHHGNETHPETRWAPGDYRSGKTRPPFPERRAPRPLAGILPQRYQALARSGRLFQYHRQYHPR